MLRFTQVGHALELHRIKFARGESGDPGSPLLSGQFLALHEIEQGHQAASDIRIHGGIGCLEDHAEQAADRPRERLGRLQRTEHLPADTAAQLIQTLQTMQHIGYAIEQTGLVCPAATVQIHAIEADTDLLLHGPALGAQPIERCQKALVKTAQIDIGKAPLPLQGVHQPARRTDQFAGQFQRV